MEEFEVELTDEVHTVRRDLVQQFRNEKWAKLSLTLDYLALLGEREGNPELCLRAQSLRELMPSVGIESGPARAQIDRLFDELVLQLSYLQWKSQMIPPVAEAPEHSR